MKKDKVLSYATPAGKRISRLSLVVFFAGILGFPILVGILHFTDNLELVSSDIFDKLALILVISVPLAEIVLGAVALWRIIKSAGKLRGEVFAAMGMGASILWPLAGVVLFFWTLSGARP